MTSSIDAAGRHARRLAGEPGPRPAAPAGDATTVGVLGIGASLPDHVLSNDALERLVETSDAWIFERTGIRERRIAAPDQSTADLAARAGRAAIAEAGIAPNEIDLVLVATITPDHATPAVAAVVQHALGIGSVAGFDISLACTGFLAALSTAHRLIAAGAHRHALVIGADRLSALTDYTDRDSCILFGDGAGAVVVGAAGSGGLIDHDLRVDGGGAAMIHTRLGRSHPERGRDDSPANAPADGPFLTMRGREVFRFAVQAFCDRVRDVLARNDLALDDLAWIVPHQANQRILEAGARKLGVGMDKVVSNVERCGNTSAASIPIALAEAVADGRVKRGDLIACVAFGGGLSQGVTLLRW